MWGGLLWFREMLPRPPLLSCGMMLHLSLKSFHVWAARQCFMTAQQPGDHVNYNVGDIQPVPCVWIQSTFRFLFKTVQNRNQVWGSRFGWQQRSLRNKHFHHIGQIKSLSSNCSPFYEETQMAEAHFNLSLLLAILAFSHLPRKSLRNVVDLRDEVPLTLRISWVLKLSSSCPATNMQRHCRRVFWVGRVTPNCPFLNHLQPFLQHNVPPSLIFDELLIHWQLHTVDPISVFFAAPPYHWATPHHTSCTQNQRC